MVVVELEEGGVSVRSTLAPTGDLIERIALLRPLDGAGRQVLETHRDRVLAAAAAQRIQMQALLATPQLLVLLVGSAFVALEALVGSIGPTWEAVSSFVQTVRADPGAVMWANLLPILGKVAIGWIRPVVEAALLGALTHRLRGWLRGWLAAQVSNGLGLPDLKDPGWPRSSRPGSPQSLPRRARP